MSTKTYVFVYADDGPVFKVFDRPLNDYKNGLDYNYVQGADYHIVDIDHKVMLPSHNDYEHGSEVVYCFNETIFEDITGYLTNVWKLAEY